MLRPRLLSKTHPSKLARNVTLVRISKEDTPVDSMMQSFWKITITNLITHETVNRQ